MVANRITFLCGTDVNSPFQISGELQGAAHMVDDKGNKVPYSDLMLKAVKAIDELRFFLSKYHFSPWNRCGF